MAHGPGWAAVAADSRGYDWSFSCFGSAANPNKEQEIEGITFVLRRTLLPELIPPTFVLVYAPGVTMTQETYRFAFDEASVELREIDSRFEQLRVRKERMEQIIDALRPLMAGEQAQVETTTQRTATAVIEPVAFSAQAVQAAAAIPAEPVALPMQEPEVVEEPAFAGEVSSDPFQRRIDNALKHGFSSRESRILPRALNGLLSRA
jgi:hypothetical protein